MIRSNKITKSAKGQPCTLRTPWCNDDKRTTVWCHSPFSMHGHGGSIKSHDPFGCYGCSACHDVLDGRTHAKDVTREEKEHMFMHAHAESVLILVELGIIKIL